MNKVKDIITFLDQVAPPAYQEDYDNAGLIIGNKESIVTGVLITLDSTEDVVSEAIEKGCNLIVAHHPIIFRGLKKITGKNYIERTIIKAIQNDIAIYASHTNLDNITGGVNSKIAEVLNLKKTRILSPKSKTLSKLSFYCPEKESKNILEGLYDAGAGNIGNYKDCSFSSEGIGTFTPTGKANPSLGKLGKTEKIAEKKIEIILPTYLENNIIQKLKELHPYEEVAYYLTNIKNKNQEIGSGIIGELNTELPIESFFNLLKDKFNLTCIRHTPFHIEKVKKIALCGGAGNFLLKKAIIEQADIFISADFKYHEFFDAENKITIADIGHFESEVFTKDLFYKLLREKFINIALYLSEVETNPVKNFI